MPERGAGAGGEMRGAGAGAGGDMRGGGGAGGGGAGVLRGAEPPDCPIPGCPPVQVPGLSADLPDSSPKPRRTGCASCPVWVCTGSGGAFSLPRLRLPRGTPNPASRAGIWFRIALPSASSRTTRRVGSPKRDAGPPAGGSGFPCEITTGPCPMPLGGVGECQPVGAATTRGIGVQLFQPPGCQHQPLPGRNIQLP